MMTAGSTKLLKRQGREWCGRTKQFRKNCVTCNLKLCWLRSLWQSRCCKTPKRGITSKSLDRQIMGFCLNLEEVKGEIKSPGAEKSIINQGTQ